MAIEFVLNFLADIIIWCQLKTGPVHLFFNSVDFSEVGWQRKCRIKIIKKIDSHFFVEKLGRPVNYKNVFYKFFLWFDLISHTCKGNLSHLLFSVSVVSLPCNLELFSSINRHFRGRENEYFHRAFILI